MNNILKKILNAFLWLVCGFCLLFAFAFFPSLSSLCFLLTALVAAPLRPLKELLSRLHLSRGKSALIAVAFFVVGFFSAPVDSNRSDSPSLPENEPAAVVVQEDERKPQELPSPAAKPDPEPAKEEPAPVAEPEPAAEPAAAPAAPQVSAPAEEVEYILNTSTMKFHKPTCSSVSKIASHNKQGYIGTRDDVLSRGYEPCGQCHP